MLQIRANHNTPFQEFLYNNLRYDPVAELIRSGPPYNVCWGILFQRAKIRRRLQSDQGQNANHGQTDSPTGMFMFD